MDGFAVWLGVIIRGHARAVGAAFSAMHVAMPIFCVHNTKFVALTAERAFIWWVHRVLFQFVPTADTLLQA